MKKKGDMLRLVETDEYVPITKLESGLKSLNIQAHKLDEIKEGIYEKFLYKVLDGLMELLRRTKFVDIDEIARERHKIDLIGNEWKSFTKLYNDITSTACTECLEYDNFRLFFEHPNAKKIINNLSEINTLFKIALDDRSKSVQSISKVINILPEI
jgi:hypothetical protein